LICDFFRIDGVEGQSPLGVGHSLSDYRQAIATNKLIVAHEEDITEFVSPTVDIFNTITMHVVRPVYYGLLDLMRERLRLLAQLAFWKYRKKLDKVEQKHFTGERNAENFRKYKRYLTVRLTLAE
jgi:hypothetical protein